MTRRALLMLVFLALMAPAAPTPAQGRDVEETAYALLDVTGPLDPGRCSQEVFASWTPVPGALGYGIEYFDSHPQINRDDSRAARPDQNDGAQRGLTAPNVLLTGAYGGCEGTVGHPLFTPGRFDVHRATVTLPAERPTAAFTASVDEGTASFDGSASTPGPGGAAITTYEWDFGDGSTGTGVAPSHTYAEPGDYTVTLIVTDADGRGDVAQQVVSPEIAEPQLTVTLDLPDNAEGVIALQEPVRVRATVRATDPGTGGTLIDVRPSASEQALVLAGPLELVSPFEPADPATLDAGRSVAFIATVRATGEEDVGITTTWRAMQGDGDVITATDELAPIRINPLQVDIVGDPNPLELGVDANDDGEVTPDEQHMDITVRVTNRSDEPITSIDALDPDSVLAFEGLRDDPDNPGEALCLVGGDVQQPPPEGSQRCFDPETLEPTQRPTATSSFGDLDPGQSTELTYSHEVYDEMFVDATATVLGVRAGETVRGTGAAELKGSADIVARITLQLEAASVRGGQPVRVVGTVENTTDDTETERQIAVVFYPQFVQGTNGGGGFLREAGQATRTALEPQVLQLDAGQDLDIDGIIATMALPQPSQAEVTYVPRVRILGEDGEWTQAREAQIDTVLDVDAGIGPRQTATVTVEPDVPETRLVCPDEPGLFGGVDHVSCRFSRGVIAFGVGLGDLAGLVGSGLYQIGDANYRTYAWVYWATGQVIEGVAGDPDAIRAIAQDIAISLQAAKDTGDPILQAIGNLDEAVFTAFDRFVRETARVVTSGNIREISGAVAEFVGENPDLAFEALVAARGMRHMIAGATGVTDNAANAALRESAQRSGPDLEDEVRAAAARGEDPTTSGIMPNGVDVTNAPFITRTLYGLGGGDLGRLLRLSAAEAVQIAFRSRHPRAIELIERALAWPKPAGLYIKTVNDIDTRYLGYSDEWLATVQLVEPPIPWSHAGSTERAQAIETYLNQFTDLSGTSAIAQSRRAEVAARLETRLDEWPRYLQEYSDYAVNGVPVDFQAVDNGVPGFLAGFVGDNVPRRRADISSSTFTGTHGQAGRQRFELRMEGPNGEPARLITGDVDFVAILNPDGSPVTSILKRIRLYRQLRSLLGMQHGETFAWILTGKRNKLLANHVDGVDGSETLLVAGPDGRLRTAKFEDRLSITENGPNADLSGEPDFLLLSGVPHQLVSDTTLGRELNLLLEALPFYADLLLAGDVVPLGLTRALVEELTEGLEQTVTRQDGSPCRATQQGGMECYGPAAPDPPAAFSAASFAGDGAVSEELATEFEEVTEAGYAAAVPVDPLGRAWLPADPDEVVANGADQDVLELLPLTYLTEPAAAGDVALEAVTDPSAQSLPTDTVLFEPGDLVVVGPGTPEAEVARVASASPMVLSTPLRHHHLEGTTVLLHEPSAGERVTRLSGAGRIETSVEASRDGFPIDGSAAAVVLARGDDFPDALTGTPLAVALGGPLLLTATDALSPPTLEEIQRVLPGGGTVHLLGGEAALSAQVEADVVSAGYAVVRHAGASRYDTAVVVADALAGLRAAEAVVLATGNAAPDALAAGVVAARQRGVVLLTNDDQPIGPTTDWLVDLFGRPLLALGGPAATAYPDATPIVGTNRFETAALAADVVPAGPGALGVIASGERFPDALSGGWLAAQAGGVVLYAAQASLPAATADALTAIGPGRVAVLGGTAALDTAVAEAVAGALPPG